jgi:hypothetical protein
VAVRARRHLEQHVAVADDAAQFAFRHGWLLSSKAKVDYPNAILTLPRIGGVGEHRRRRVCGFMSRLRFFAEFHPGRAGSEPAR